MSKTITRSDLNDVQRRVLDDVLDYVLCGDVYEVKELDLTDSYGDICVGLTTGVKNDEGTMAFFICRDRYVFWIGKRGGVWQYVEGRDGHYRRVYRKHGFVKKLC